MKKLVLLCGVLFYYNLPHLFYGDIHAGSFYDNFDVPEFLKKDSDRVYEVYSEDGKLFSGRIVLRSENIIRAYDTDAIVNAASEACTGGGGIDGVIHGAAGKLLEEFNEQAFSRLDTTNPNIRCPKGDARISPSFDLFKASKKRIKYIISTTGPFGTDADRELMIMKCYKSCIQLAADFNLQMIFGMLSSNKFWAKNIQELDEWTVKISQQTYSLINAIMFPPLSAGIFRYSLSDSAPHVLVAVIEAMREYAITLSLQKRDTHASKGLRPFVVILTLYGQENDPIALYEALIRRACDKDGRVRFSDRIVEAKSFYELKKGLDVLRVLGASS